MKKLTRLFVASLCMAALAGCGQQPKNTVIEPKEVDVFIEEMANLIANGMNAALHEAINQDNTGYYTH